MCVSVSRTKFFIQTPRGVTNLAFFCIVGYLDTLPAENYAEILYFLSFLSGFDAQFWGYDTFCNQTSQTFQKGLLMNLEDKNSQILVVECIFWFAKVLKSPKSMLLCIILQP